MELDSDMILRNAILDGVRESIKSKLAGYNSPLDKLLTEAINQHANEIHKLLQESIGSCIKDASFRDAIACATRSQLAKLLVQRFGGELEKQVNVLKSDPTTRARITLAIEEIVKAQTH